MRALRWSYVLLGLSVGACLVEGETINPDAPEAGASAGKGGDDPGKTPGDAGQPGSGNSSSGGSDSHPQGGTTSQNTSGTANATAGDNSGTGGDPGSVLEPPIDPNCGDYVEQSDIANSREMSFEDSKLELTNELTICGRINIDHYLNATGLIDEDAIGFDVKTGNYVLTLEILDTEVPDRIELTGTEASGATRTTVGAHDRAILLMPAAMDGSMSFRLKAFGSPAPAHSLLYRVRVRPDDAAARCPSVMAVTATQRYTESKDGAANNGNDLIRPDFKKDLQIPTATADQPEPSAIVLGVGDHSLIEGSAANVTYGQTYNDVDTYAIKTGNSTELSLRVDWAGKGADMDVMVFKENDYAQLVQTNRFVETAPEILTLAVEPQTKYWILLGAASDVDTNGYPKAYSLSLCGAALDP